MNILVTDHYNRQSLARLSQDGLCEVHFSNDVTPTENELKNIDVLLIRSKTNINEELLKQSPQLKLIISSTSGFDHIDLNMTQNYNVKVMYTPSANIQSVAELTVSLFLELARRTRQSSEIINKNLWKNNLPLASEISGKNLSIIGLGRIGSQVAKLAQAFGMNVAAYDPYKDEDIFSSLNVERLGFVESLKHADFLSLHVPYTKKTHHLINTANLSHLSSRAFLVNTSRGAVIEENHLFNALKEQSIAGAALDVFNREPICADHKLLALKNCIATPHIGGYTNEAYLRASDDAVTKLIDFINHQKTTDSLPPKEEWHHEDHV